MRPFRFGVLLEHKHATRDELIELARRSEGDGYDIALGTDHLGRLAPMPLIQAIADVSGLRIGMLVLNNDFRHPVVLAGEMATLDLVTDGRLEIGLGAGWARVEYEGAAMQFERPGKRLARLQATVSILKQALSEGRVDHEGADDYGSVHIGGLPRSLQRPYPPFLIGGGGPRVMELAGREAQIVGFDWRATTDGGHEPRDITAEAIDNKVSWIRAAAGDRADELEVNVIVFEIDPEYRAGATPRFAMGALSPEEILVSPHYLVGDIDSMADTLIERRERWGINYYAIKMVHMDALAPLVRRLAGT